MSAKVTVGVQSKMATRKRRRALLALVPVPVEPQPQAGPSPLPFQVFYTKLAEHLVGLEALRQVPMTCIETVSLPSCVPLKENRVSVSPSSLSPPRPRPRLDRQRHCPLRKVFVGLIVGVVAFRREGILDFDGVDPLLLLAVENSGPGPANRSQQKPRFFCPPELLY